MNWLKQLTINRKSRFGLFCLAAMVLIALFGPLLVHDPLAYIAKPHEPPSTDHWFGTTGQGQDVLAQTVVGAGPTLWVAFIVSLISTLIGAGLGLLSGFARGRTDDLINLLINIFLVVPGLPLAVVIAAYLPAGPITIAAVLILTGWAWTARVIRAQTYTISEKDFVLAAKVVGEPSWRILWIEILPNMGSLLTSCFIGNTVYAIGAQVGLEFLGLGDISTVTWGTNLYWATNDSALLIGSWWTFVPTGLSVALTGFALTLLTFGVDEITNPGLAAESRWRRYLQTKGITPSTHTPVVRS
ncbi:MAG: peptide ABC transporter permease [Myxococcales bacterium]|nr:peptide ABC transporter permease [Myxococcales bacterium]|tara:strand:- start:343 stop:1242 length:900 start_codon:yes stop_codon:yes gene_type:complete